MKQYHAIKSRHPGAILLFRVGDFYETFEEDAKKASKALGIVLTKRSNGAASEVSLAGFPHHALDSYLPKLVKAGYRVAICDQLEDPKMVKGIVKRGITELVTPGLSYNDEVLESNTNNYLGAVHRSLGHWALSLLDISTGEFFVSEGTESSISKNLKAFAPSEILIQKKESQDFLDLFGNQFNLFFLDDWVFTRDFGYEKLLKQFRSQNLKGYGIEDFDSGIACSGAILHYLEETEHKHTEHINRISRLDDQDYVWMDQFTIENLELLNSRQNEGTPLIEILDQTVSPMGSRLMKRWVVMPSKHLKEIKKRQNAVRIFYEEEELADNLTRLIRSCGDLSRLISKIAAKRVNPRELKAVSRAMAAIHAMKEYPELLKSPLLEFSQSLNSCPELQKRINETLIDEPGFQSNQGGIIREEFSADLDELRKIASSGKEQLEKIRKRESEKAGIPKLKISFNRVFGYYLEVSNVHKEKVPADWIRKQTLVNAERYITEELKIFEEKILNADGKIKELEQSFFMDLIEDCQTYVPSIQKSALNVGEIDCLISLARTGTQRGYCFADINESLDLKIRSGRHAVIETQLPPGEKYIPNDLMLDPTKSQILVITGPNMAGKSAFLRQNALIVLMAQMGGMVPAESVEAGIIDKIFTRVGASDNLSKGESTFMVEMSETASILNNLSERSLVIMDEIGRGTSTFDGISIAWSIVEHLHNEEKCNAKTLFATHYHELNELAGKFKKVKNFNVSVKELGNKVLFLRKLVEGGSEHSFGIHVAQMAGIPNPVVLRAHEVLMQLEESNTLQGARKEVKNIKDSQYQMSAFEANDPKYLEVKKLLENTDINLISPVDALLKLNELKKILGK
jgi:DNA mismatch repair protein MutS